MTEEITITIDGVIIQVHPGSPYWKPHVQLG